MHLSLPLVLLAAASTTGAARWFDSAPTVQRARLAIIDRYLSHPDAGRRFAHALGGNQSGFRRSSGRKAAKRLASMIAGDIFGVLRGLDEVLPPKQSDSVPEMLEEVSAVVPDWRGLETSQGGLVLGPDTLPTDAELESAEHGRRSADNGVSVAPNDSPRFAGAVYPSAAKQSRHQNDIDELPGTEYYHPFTGSSEFKKQGNRGAPKKCKADNSKSPPSPFHAASDSKGGTPCERCKVWYYRQCALGGAKRWAAWEDPPRNPGYDTLPVRGTKAWETAQTFEDTVAAKWKTVDRKTQDGTVPP
jgi:hypothetical protein